VSARGGRRLAARRGMTLVEVVVAMFILTGVLLSLGSFSMRFAQANSQAHLVITANEIAASRLDEVHTQPTYAAVGTMATAVGSPDQVRADGVTFLRATSVRQVGGTPADSVNYKAVTVVVTQQMMRKTVSKTTAIAAW